MSKTITANFDSIDIATIAASNAKDRCDNVKGVKIKYKALENKRNSYIFSNAFTPVDGSTPSILQNGIFPVAVNVDAIGQDDSYPVKDRKATVEIIASDDNTGKICSTLRQNGGIGVKVN